MGNWMGVAIKDEISYSTVWILTFYCFISSIVLILESSNNKFLFNFNKYQFLYEMIAIFSFMVPFECSDKIWFVIFQFEPVFMVYIFDNSEISLVRNKERRICKQRRKQNSKSQNLTNSTKPQRLQLLSRGRKQLDRDVLPKQLKMKMSWHENTVCWKSWKRGLLMKVNLLGWQELMIYRSQFSNSDTMKFC